jgi:hypothetical protein
MCFRPLAPKREIPCPKCKKMNPLPLSIESPVSQIVANESAKAIFDKHCSVLTGDPRFKSAMGMTLKQIRPMSGGKLTQEMIDAVAGELAQLPVTNVCKFCGEALPQPPAGTAGPAGRPGPSGPSGPSGPKKP